MPLFLLDVPPFVGSGRGERGTSLWFGWDVGDLAQCLDDHLLWSPGRHNHKRLLRKAGAQDGVWYIRRSLELCIDLNDGQQRNISRIQKIQRETCHILTPKEHLSMLLTVVCIADKGTLWWRCLPTLKPG